MAPKCSRGGKLTQLMTNQILGNHHFDVPPTVVNHKRVPNKLGNDRARTSPSLDGLFRASRFLLLNLQIQFFVNVWTFFL